MGRRALIGAFVLSVVASSAVWAAPGDMSYPILGVGTSSCGVWTRARAGTDFDLDKAAISSWLLGYVTAVNFWTTASSRKSGGVSEGYDNEALLAWVDNYCKANPLQTIEKASGNLLRELLDRRESKEKNR
jgi:hypothetical protein